MHPYRLEIPVFSSAAARKAAALGAHRVELNAAGSYPDGGLTPSLAELSDLVSAARGPSEEARSVPVRVMIRPRGPPPTGPDFVYTDDEFRTGMRDAIAAFKASGLLDAARGDGFVFGVLERGPAGGGGGMAVDAARNAELVALARPLPCVFHRALDGLVADEPAMRRALGQVAACGFAGVLTSGGPGAAPDSDPGALGRLVAHAAALGVEVVLGGGVRARNARHLVERVLAPAPSAVWLHSSCLAVGGRGDLDEAEVAGLLAVLADPCKATG